MEIYILENIFKKVEPGQKIVLSTKYYSKCYTFDILYIFAFCAILHFQIFYKCIKYFSFMVKIVLSRYKLFIRLKRGRWD